MRPDQARQSSTSLVCSAMWMWIGPPSARGRIACELRGCDGAQAVRCDADHRVRQVAIAPRASLEQPRVSVDGRHETALARAGRGAANRNAHRRPAAG